MGTVPNQQISLEPKDPNSGWRKGGSVLNCNNYLLIVIVPLIYWCVLTMTNHNHKFFFNTTFNWTLKGSCLRAVSVRHGAGAWLTFYRNPVTNGKELWFWWHAPCVRPLSLILALIKWYSWPCGLATAAKARSWTGASPHHGQAYIMFHT